MLLRAYIYQVREVLPLVSFYVVLVLRMPFSTPQIAKAYCTHVFGSCDASDWLDAGVLAMSHLLSRGMSATQDIAEILRTRLAANSSMSRWSDDFLAAALREICPTLLDQFPPAKAVTSRFAGMS